MNEQVAIEPRKKTIMVVDDEKGIRSDLRNFLPPKTYYVIDLDSSRRALEFADLVTVNLLVVDSVLPYIYGRDLAQKVSQRQPDVKVLFMSGCSGAILFEKGILPTGAYLLGKPFNQRELVSKVQNILENGQSWESIAKAG